MHPSNINNVKQCRYQFDVNGNIVFFFNGVDKVYDTKLLILKYKMKMITGLKV